METNEVRDAMDVINTFILEQEEGVNTRERLLKEYKKHTKILKERDLLFDALLDVMVLLGQLRPNAQVSPRTLEAVAGRWVAKEDKNNEPR